MVTLSTSILTLFLASCLLYFAAVFLKDHVIKQLTHKQLIPGLVPFALMLIPFAAMFFIAHLLKVDVSKMLPAFAVAATVSFILSRIGLPPALRGILLLVGSFSLTMNMASEEGTLTIASALLGLLSWKVTENLFVAEESSLEDILPPLFWLGGLMWIRASSAEAQLVLHESILATVISCSLIVKGLQLLLVYGQPMLQVDNLFLKRIILAALGGLGVLIVINKLLLAPQMANVALLAGTGMLAALLFKNADKDEQDVKSGLPALKLLIVMGLLMVVATRFWGTLGLVFLAPTALVMHGTCLAQYAGIFFIMRAMLQAFLVTFNANVTGINLTHPYVGASLYGGFMLAAIFMILFRDIKDRRVLLSIFLGGGVLVPIASNYFLHAEPTCGLLVSTAVATTLLATLGHTFLSGEKVRFENLFLLCLLMISSGMLTGQLIEAGNYTTIQVKTTMLGYGIGFVAVCSIVYAIIFKVSSKKTVAVSTGD